MKNIVIDYKGSFVKTIDGIGTFILIIGIIASVVLVVIGMDDYNDSMNYYINAFIVLFSSFFIYALLSALSKILEHFLYIRKYVEFKANEEDVFFQKNVE